MSRSSAEEVGRELADLAFGIVEQNWLDQHVAKAITPETIASRDEAEWELTYLILFAITLGCGAFAGADPEWTTAVLKHFHRSLLGQIAEQAGQDIASAHEKNLPSRYRLYADATKGEDDKGPHRLLGEAAAIQILGKPIEDRHAADNFRETMKVILTEVREAAIRVMRLRFGSETKDAPHGL